MSITEANQAADSMVATMRNHPTAGLELCDCGKPAASRSCYCDPCELRGLYQDLADAEADHSFDTAGEIADWIAIIEARR